MLCIYSLLTEESSSDAIYRVPYWVTLSFAKTKVYNLIVYKTKSPV